MNFTNIIDVVTLLVILLFGVIGFEKGFFKQVVATVGFIITVVLAWYFKTPLAEFLCLHLPFFKFGGSLGGATSLNIILYQLISFLIMVIIFESVLQFIIRITNLFEKLLRLTIVLGIFSKILGFLFGMLEGFVIVFIALFFLKQPAFNISQFEGSKLSENILNSTPVLSGISKDFSNTFNDIYLLTEKYVDQNDDSNTLNYEALKVMLEHNIIRPSFARKLYDADKINIIGFDSLMAQYE